MTQPCKGCNASIEVPLSMRKLLGVWGRCPLCGQLFHFKFNGDGRLKKTTYPKRLPSKSKVILMKLKVAKTE